MSADYSIQKLVAAALHTNDPETLWQIARQLEHFSAWVEAREVERKAEQQERRLAEDAAK